ncbi:hypothetical protein ONE63_011456 [Megalurothrips usitatus]|uniref:Retrovirus-related Pol polyprotein from transposon TNT 1-94 n=1 Tax=Megalurothrips usitatus TaxID=439358 RepID=A0AAV7WZ97_9NEOP|nr:hypothetical protein ONE63_011456 [Megalurothrips usitatus]
MADSKESKKHEILNGTNYRYWAKRIKAALSQKRWWEAIDPGYAEDQEIWTSAQSQKNFDALNYILQRVDDLDLDDIGDSATAKEAWETLQEVYTKLDVIQVVGVLEELCTLRKTEEVSMREYISSVIRVAEEVRATGLDISEEMSAAFVLKGLNHIPKYKTLIQAKFNGVANDDLTMKKVKNILLFEERQDQIEARKDEASASVCKSSYRAYNPKTEYNHERRNEERRNEERRSEERRDDERRSEERRYVCFACQKPGHIARECPKFKKKEESENSKKYRKKGEKKMSGRKAEYSEEDSSGCDDEEEVTAKAAKLKVRSKVVVAVIDSEDSEDFKAVASKSSLNDKEKKEPTKIWFADSGASHHMTPHKEIMKDFNGNVKGSVKWGDGQKSPVKGKGSVVLKLEDDCGGYELTLKEVYYAPDLEQNLMSERQFDEKGFKVTTYKGVKKVSDKNEIFLKAHWDNEAKMYRVNAEAVLSRNEKEASGKKENISLTGKRASVDLWHRRFGHLVTLPKVCEVKGKLSSNCETCLAGKAKKKPFAASESRAKENLEIVHSDVCEVPDYSLNRSKYFITFLDDHSRYSEVGIMKKKSEAFENFKQFMAKAERLQNLKLIALQTDNGGEYTSQEFSTFLSEKGIERRLSIPYTPEQNGRAERLNQTLLQIARYRLKTGFLWYKKELMEEDFEMLKVFGCEAWMKTHDKVKLKIRAERCVFMGLSPEQKGFKLWHLKQQHFVSARNVNFNEEIYPFKIELNKKKHSKPIVTRYYISDDSEDEKEENPEQENQQQENPDPENNEREEEENHSGNEEERHESEEEPEQEPEEEPEQEPEPEEEPVRRSKRIQERHSKGKCDGCVGCKTTNLEEKLYDPVNVEEALSSFDAKFWKEAMDEEIDRLLQMETWKVVPRPENHKVIDCKWVFRRKFNELGEIIVHKARLVARGFCLTPGVDYMETYAPVVRKSSIRLMLALAAEKQLEVEQLDVKSAYLNSTLKEQVYMEQPKGCEVKSKRDFVCLIDKSIYGLPQSGRNWNDEVNEKSTKYWFDKI